MRTRPKALTQTDHSRKSADGPDDFGRRVGPSEGPGATAVLGDVALDGGLKINDAGEGAAPQAAAGQGGEEAPTAMSQEAEVGVRWKVQRG